MTSAWSACGRESRVKLYVILVLVNLIMTGSFACILYRYTITIETFIYGTNALQLETFILCYDLSNVIILVMVHGGCKNW